MLWLTLLRKFWFVVPMAALLAWGAWERHEASSAQAQVVALNQQLGAAEQSIDQLRAGVQAQNSAVERILQQGEANVAAAKSQAAQREQSAARVQVVYRTRVERIEAAPVSATCASAAAWAAGQAQGLTAGW